MIRTKERVRLAALITLLVAFAAIAVITATPAQGQEGDLTVQQASGDIVITSVDLGGAEAAIVITNNGSATAELSGWFVCNIPAYFALPDITLAAGASVTLHAGSGADTATDIFADGGFGSLSGDGAGEIALYEGNEFGNADSIRAYVGWNGGKGRKSVAQAAGIWDDTDITTAAGDTITYVGDATGAAAYSVPAQEDGEPVLISADSFAATLSGAAEVPSLASDGSGSFQLVSGEVSATFTLVLANVTDISQAHIHQGAADANGGVVAFLFDPIDPGASTQTALSLSGTLSVEDLVGALEGDWDGFLAGLAAGTLYVNVHSAANPAGELRGQIAAGTAAAPTIGVAVPQGVSLVGWFGVPTSSADIIAANVDISGLWYLSAASGWILDSEDLPSFARPEITIELGGGFLVITVRATVVAVPLS